MLYKEVICPDCKGCGFVDKGIGRIDIRHCSNCNSTGYINIPMTNGDLIKTCTNDQIAEIFYNLRKVGIRAYSDGDHFNLTSIEGILRWLNKDTNDADLELFFPFINIEDCKRKPYIKAYIDARKNIEEDEED